MKSKTITKIILAFCLIATIALALNTVFADDINIPSVSTAGYSNTGLDTATSNVLGIKWIAAAPEAKADIKKQAIIYVVGAALVFAAGGILTIIKAISKNTFTS